MSAPAAAPGPAVAVEPAQQELLLEEVDRFAASLARPEARERYARLREAAAAGSVDGELVAALEDLLEITLGSRRVHRFHGPGAERALLDLYARTPRGAAVEAASRAANRALETVRGQRLEGLTFRPGVPGTHRLVVETERCRLTLEIGPGGISAREVAL